MAAVYNHLDGGQEETPRELELFRSIRLFGVEAVMGRPALARGEIRRMVSAVNVETAYNSRAESEDWADWAKRNPALNEILVEAMRADHE